MHRTQKLGMLVVASVAVLVSTGCARDDYDDRADTLAVGGDVDLTTGATSVGDIMDNPSRYSGDTVTVEADVEEVLGTFAFMLDEDDPIAGGIDNDLLVISSKSAQLQSIDDQWVDNRVRVTGVVRQSGDATFERDIEWDLTPEIRSKFEEQRPVLIAHRVERVGSR